MPDFRLAVTMIFGGSLAQSSSARRVYPGVGMTLSLRSDDSLKDRRIMLLLLLLGADCGRPLKQPCETANP